MLSFIKKIQGKGKGRQPESSQPGAARVPEGTAAALKAEVSRKILVVGKGESLDPEAIDYAVNLAERLGYDLVAVNVNPTQGINFEHLVKFGDLGQAVADVNRQVKRIEFVITQDGIKETEVNGEINLPVFSITGYQGERTMAKASDNSRTKLIGKTAGLGLAAAGLYAAVFLNADTVMKYFTKGAWYAALPVATVFIFSFVHGAFASEFWSLRGIEATKKAQPKPTVAKRPAARKRPRPQLRIDT
jgi:hypothetical protein